MTKWEYLPIWWENHNDLNNLGKDGWELVSCTMPHYSDDGMGDLTSGYAVFKRLIEEPANV